jgi:hypothetical protein
VLVNLVADANTGYVPGDEVPYGLGSSSLNAVIEPPCSVWVDATNVYLHSGFLSIGNEGHLFIFPKKNAPTVNISSANNWALKCYCIVPTNGTSFTEPDQSNNTGASSFLHGLGGTANLIYPTLHCTNADANFASSSGQEVEYDALAQNAGAKGCPSACRSSTSSLISNTAMFFAGNEANFDGWVRAAFNYINPSSLNNFVMRNRAWLMPLSFQQTLSHNSGAFTFNHGFSKTPQLLYASIACIANDAASGFSAGDETPMTMVTNQTFASAVCNVACNATQIFGHTGLLSVGSEAVTNIWQTKASNINPTSFNNFALKIYAWAI